MNNQSRHDICAVRWLGGCLELLDQRLLPEQEKYIRIHTLQEATDAIHSMVVRGAPAIGVTAAYAVVLAAREQYTAHPVDWRHRIEDDLQRLGTARPTAINLRWAINRMRAEIKKIKSGDPEPRLLALAKRIHEDDVAANLKISALGAEFIGYNSTVLTHCNAGALATGGHGTALGVIRTGYRQGKIAQVYADETRPWLQGSRLTAWELSRDGIPVTLIPDVAAAYLMQQGRLAWVIVGADRIAVNGDVANKIGTYSLAVNARAHHVKFMVAAPLSTIDPEVTSGADIPIETRDPREVLTVLGRMVAPSGVEALNPVFDITPASLVDVIVTEVGAIEAPDEHKIRTLLEKPSANSPGSW